MDRFLGSIPLPGARAERMRRGDLAQKGLRFGDSRTVPPKAGLVSGTRAAVLSIGGFLRVPNRHELMTRNRRFRFVGWADGNGPQVRGRKLANVGRCEEGAPRCLFVHR